MLYGEIKERGSGYVVEYSWAMDSEPMRITYLYPVTVSQGLIDLNRPQVTYDVGDGGVWRGLGFQVGTDEKRAIVEKTPIAPPKTKLPTRWHNGQWEKYSKVSGWRNY